MNQKRLARSRRAKKTRKKIQQLGIDRLSVHRTYKHIYAQVVSGETGDVITSAATVEAELKKQQTGNIKAATAVGELIAKRAIAKGVKKVAFDRSGFQYHGRVKALAEAARSKGLVF